MDKLTPEKTAEIRDGMRRVIAEVERVIVGKRDVIEFCVIALLARGHVLIEDVPGVGKTMLAKAFARALGGSFKRIQFTPDLLPGDVTGLSIYKPQSGEFSFVPGPVFANILLADEINRATPKTQSALLEAMEESQVTIDGTTRVLPQPFLTLATQNPVEYRGTYPLPEAQMDRFLMRVHLGYPTRSEEIEVMRRHCATRIREEQSSDSAEIESETSSGAAPRRKAVETGQASALLANVEEALTIEQARHFQNERMKVEVSEALCEYMVDLTHATRAHMQVALGASPRAALALQRAVQAAALLEGRSFVIPDDVKKLAPLVLAHRLILRGDSSDVRPAEDVVYAVLGDVPVP